jgi:hypothetical protein
MLRAFLAATVIIASLGLPASADPQQARGRAQNLGMRGGSGMQGRGQHHYALAVRGKNGKGGTRIVHTFSSMRRARKAQQKLQMKGLHATIQRV